jgi:hypothetical protein
MFSADFISSWIKRIKEGSGAGGGGDFVAPPPRFVVRCL